MTFSNRDDFYDELWSDYSDHLDDVSKCFYYRYLKKKKSSEAESDFSSWDDLTEYLKSGRINKYYLLHGAYHAYRNKKISADQYKQIFMKLNTKISKKYQKLLDENNITDVNALYENELLKICTVNFFDNEGYKPDADVTCTGSRHRRDKYTDIIDMHYQYTRLYKKDDREAAGAVRFIESGYASSEEYIDKCTALYEAVCRENKTKAFIPLHFDVNSGAGIYIVGKENFSDHKKNAPGCCSICILYFSYVENADSTLSGGGGCEMCIYMMGEFYKTVQEAFDAFRKAVHSDEGFYTYMENYGYANNFDEGYFSAHGIDDIFRSRVLSADLRGGRGSAKSACIAVQSQKEKRSYAVLNASDKRSVKGKGGHGGK